MLAILLCGGIGWQTASAISYFVYEQEFYFGTFTVPSPNEETQTETERQPIESEENVTEPPLTEESIEIPNEETEITTDAIDQLSDVENTSPLDDTQKNNEEEGID